MSSLTTFVGGIHNPSRSDGTPTAPGRQTANSSVAAEPLFLTGGIFLAEGAEMLIMGGMPR